MLMPTYGPVTAGDPVRYYGTNDNLKRMVITLIALAILGATLAYSAHALRQINFHKW